MFVAKESLVLENDFYMLFLLKKNFVLSDDEHTPHYHVSHVLFPPRAATLWL